MRRWAGIAMTVMVGLVPMASPSASPAAADAPRPRSAAEAAGSTDDASVYVPVTPQRLLDTRTTSTPAAGAAVVVPVGTPYATPSADVTAVVVNVTVTGTTGPGFVTVYPAGTARPATSTLNIERPGQNVANLSTVRTALLETGPAVELFTTVRTDLVVDVVGYYVRRTGDVAAGRYVVVGPVRVGDTREAADPYVAEETRSLDLTTLGVPTDAVSAVLNITAVDAPDGYWTVYPAGTALPPTSSLNVSRLFGRPEVGQVVANQVITPLGEGGLSIYSQSGGDLVVDLFGYYTGASATPSGDGRFVPLAPTRVLDTRNTAQPGDAATVAIDAGTLTSAGIDLTSAEAIALNLTATVTTRPGFFTAHASGRPRPETSNLNVTAGAQTIANHTVVPVSTSGASIFVQARSHVVADLFGWFTGTPAPIVTTPSAPTTPTTPGAPSTPSSPSVPTTNAPAPTGPHEFLYQFGDGTYARWDPCDAISYRVNPANVSADVLDRVTVALQRVSEISGLTFQYLGTTSSFSTTPDSGTDATIAFPTSAQAPQLSGSVVGLGGGRYSGSGAVVSGFVFARADAVMRMTPDQQLEVLLHEIGHMVGLAHVYAGGSYGDNPDPTRYTDWGAEARMQTMYPILLAPRGYASGDREGLIAVGATKGCLARRINRFAERDPGPLFTMVEA